MFTDPTSRATDGIPTSDHAFSRKFMMGVFLEEGWLKKSNRKLLMTFWASPTTVYDLSMFAETIGSKIVRAW